MILFSSIRGGSGDSVKSCADRAAAVPRCTVVFLRLPMKVVEARFQDRWTDRGVHAALGLSADAIGIACGCVEIARSLDFFLEILIWLRGDLHWTPSVGREATSVGAIARLAGAAFTGRAD